MTNNEIEICLKGMVKQFVEFNDGEEKLALYTIMSDSKQAVNFISLIEDELSIEFNDEDINIEFFSSLDHITNLINNYTS